MLKTIFIFAALLAPQSQAQIHEYLSDEKKLDEKTLVYAPGICYRQTYDCSGDSLGWMPSSQACFQSDGLSFRESNGSCISADF